MTSTTPVILITGASSGIGAASARTISRAGYRVVLAARRVEELNSLADRIRQEGGDALPVPTDLAKLEQIESLVALTLQVYGRIDVLFNNAGLGHMNWLELMDPVEDINYQLQINLLGLIHTTRTVLPYMIKQRSGHVINMASIASMVATPTYSIYAASKFGVRGFTEALRREVDIFGIRVSGIYPGGVDTEFSQHMGRVSKTGITTPKKLRLTAEDLAETVLGVIKHPRRMVIIPRVMWLVVALNSIAPALVDWGIRWRFTSVERNTP